MERLFSYGTLQQEQVQISLFGQTLSGEKAILPGYIVAEVRIHDPAVIAASGKEIHPILQYTGNPKDQVTGTVFEISTAQLEQVDRYEVEDYQRVRAVLNSGKMVWIYTNRGLDSIHN